MSQENSPATREDLAALESRLLDAMRRSAEEVETKLLTAFHGYARGVEARIRVSQTIGVAATERLDALESRVLDIEQRLLQR